MEIVEKGVYNWVVDQYFILSYLSTMILINVVILHLASEFLCANGRDV
jgi:hypothetical protein